MDDFQSEIKDAVKRALANGVQKADILWALKEAHRDAAVPDGLTASGHAECGRTKLQRAAKDGDVDLVDALIRVGADVNGNPNYSGTPLAYASAANAVDVVEALINARADIMAKGHSGGTALHSAAAAGAVDVTKVLLRAGADAKAEDFELRTPVDCALERDHALIVPLVDPARAKAEGEKLRMEFQRSPLVHVISTRFKRAVNNGCDPKEAAKAIKCFLETGKAVDREEYDVITEPVAETKVFNPNADNAFLMIGDSEAANAIWLRNWREIGLSGARRTGGYCIQIVVQGGLSDMQIAEQDMAFDKGVPVVQLFCDDIAYWPTHWDLEPKLIALAEAMRKKPSNLQEPIEVRVPKGAPEGDLMRPPPPEMLQRSHEARENRIRERMASRQEREKAAHPSQ